MVGHPRGEGRGRPNGRACYHPEYPPPNEEAQDSLDPPYYVQDLNKQQRSLGEYHQPPPYPRPTSPKAHLTQGCERRTTWARLRQDHLTRTDFARAHLTKSRGGGGPLDHLTEILVVTTWSRTLIGPLAGPHLTKTLVRSPDQESDWTYLKGICHTKVPGIYICNILKVVEDLVRKVLAEPT